MRVTKILSAIAAALLATGLTTVAFSAPASAGLIDGSLNDLHAASQSNILGALVGSQLSDSSNNNANTRADGNANNSSD
ncbi:hypothetical protein AB0I28_31415 [Phytomonospora sp. NPDC050363]|uniref:hypothetical protein n=1 Tax=Phytomonospora sp. NPDC050363 TaxID=3155642 RepID=UPI003401E6A1